MQEYKKFTKHVGIVGIAQVLMSLRGLILIPVIAKTLGASVYGIYSTLMVTVNFLAPLSLLGLETAMVRFISGEKDKQNVQEGYYSTLTFVLLTSLLLSALVFFYAQDLADTVFGDPSAAGIIKIGSSLIILFALDKINLEFFRATHRMVLFSSLQLLETLGEVALAFVLVLQGYGLDAVIYAFLFLRLLLFVVTFVIIAGELKLKAPDFSRSAHYLSFGLPLVPTAFFSWVLSSSDRYFIGFFLGAYQVGIYSAAYGIASSINLFVSPLHTVLFPTISKLWEENRISELKTHFSYSLKYFLALIIPSFFGVSMLSSQILGLMTEQEFAAQGYLVVPVVALATVFYFALYGIYGLIFTLVKKTHYSAVIVAVSGVINIVLNVVLIPWMGIIGAALATLVSFFVVGVLSVILSRKYLTFPVDVWFIAKSIVSSAVMTSVLWLWHPVGVLGVCAAVAIGAGVYFVVLLFLGGFKKKEMEFFRGFIDAAVSKLSD